MRSIYFYDTELFAHDICERWTKDKASGEHIVSAPFHREIWEQESKKEDSLYIIARDHAKTTAGVKIRTLKEMIYGIEKTILFIMTKNLGEEVVGDIRKELETNESIKYIYGTLVPTDSRKDFKSEKWRQRELNLTNKVTLKTITKGESVRGMRPTKIRVDDPEEKKDVKNPKMAEEFWHWFFTSVYPTLDDKGSVSVFGTVLSSNCFVNKLKQQAVEKSFKLIEYPAILNFNEQEFTGTPLWPEKWSMSALHDRYKKIGAKAFLQEYMNIPFILNGSPVFNPDYKFKVVEPIKIEGEVSYYAELTGKAGFIGLDLAIGGSDGDYSTITCRGIQGELLAQYRGHITQDRLANILNSIIIKLKEVKIVPENNMGLAFLMECKKYDWYRSIYRQKTFDKITNQASEVLGWHTNAKTKPLMINDLDVRFREEFEVSQEELEEIQHYYYDERGGMNAMAPYHDDLVISDALSIQAIKSGISSPMLLII